jgi:predicted DNA-binding transcriptional regulator YafY
VRPRTRSPRCRRSPLPACSAYRTRSTVTFTYRGDGRHVDPWGILFRRGHWYVVGHDHDRGEQRSFRADRIEAT